VALGVQNDEICCLDTALDEEAATLRKQQGQQQDVDKEHYSHGVKQQLSGDAGEKA